jgi:hypothetical protein
MFARWAKNTLIAALLVLAIVHAVRQEIRIRSLERSIEIQRRRNRYQDELDLYFAGFK